VRNDETAAAGVVVGVVFTVAAAGAVILVGLVVTTSHITTYINPLP